MNDYATPPYNRLGVAFTVFLFNVCLFFLSIQGLKCAPISERYTKRSTHNRTTLIAVLYLLECSPVYETGWARVHEITTAACTHGENVLPPPLPLFFSGLKEAFPFAFSRFAYPSIFFFLFVSHSL